MEGSSGKRTNWNFNFHKIKKATHQTSGFRKTYRNWTGNSNYNTIYSEKLQREEKKT